MLSLAAKLQSRLGSIRKDESGQDAFEYLLVVGVVMLAVVGAVAAGFTPDGMIADVVGAIGDKVDTLIS